MKEKNIARYSKVFLVINTSFFGDTILTNELCRNIKKNEPQALVVFVANKPFADVARHMDSVDAVWVYDKRGEHKGIKGIYRFWKQHRGAYRIDVSFVIYGNERGILLSKLLGAKKIYSDQNRLPFSLLVDNDKLDYGNIVHIEDKNAYLYESYSQKPFDVMRMVYHVPQEAKAAVEPFLRDKKNLIAINPVTKRIEKDLRVDMVTELIDRLCRENMTPIILGVGADGRRYWESLPERTKKLAVNTVDRFTISELAAVLEACDALVTADTGTLHLALALDVPTVAVYYENAPQWLAKWAPRSIYRHRLIADGDYRAEIVWSNLSDLLKENAE